MIPHNFVALMDPSDRKSFGVQTIDEMAEKEVVHLEDKLRKMVLGYCFRHNLIVGTAQTNRKSTYTKGWADLTILFPKGEVLFAELKASTGRLRPEQRDIGERMLADGHRWRLINSYELFVSIANPLL